MGLLGDAADWVGDRVDDATDVVTDGAETVFNTGRDIVSGGLDLAGSAFDGLLDIAGDVGGAITGFFDRCVSWMGGLLADVFDSILDAVRGLFDAITDLYNRYLEVFQTLARGFEAPKTLKAVAARWASGPKATLTSLGTTLSTQGQVTSWTGPGSEQYSAQVPLQSQGVTGMTEVADGVSQSLDATADALLDFYADAGGIHGKIYAAVNGSPGSLFSLDTVLNLLNGGMSNTWQIIGGVKDLVGTAQEEQGRLQDMLLQNPALPGGQWPQATAAV